MQTMSSINETINNEKRITIIDRHELATKRAFDFMINYIKYNKTDIPENLRGSVTCDEETGLTLAMYWVFYMKTAPIPKWMMHETNITDSHKWTLAMHYITINHIYPPLYMKHKSEMQNDKGKTAAMMLLLYQTKPSDVQQWMQHNISITDNEGYTIIDYWVIANNPLPIPKWISSQIKGNINDWRNSKGESLCTLWNKYRKSEQIEIELNNENESEEEEKKKENEQLTLTSISDNNNDNDVNNSNDVDEETKNIMSLINDI